MEELTKNNMDVHFSSKSAEWQTPVDLFAKLNKEFDFKLDVAATKDNALCPNFFTEEDDALVQDWTKFGTAYMNPPYGRGIGKFIKKAWEESQKGMIVVMLIPARTDTKWWHSYCAKGEIRFIKGRLKFVNVTFPSYRENEKFELSPAPFPSAIVIFGRNRTSTDYITL